jgi:hypothetical protein
MAQALVVSHSAVSRKISNVLNEPKPEHSKIMERPREGRNLGYAILLQGLCMFHMQTPFHQDLCLEKTVQKNALH